MEVLALASAALLIYTWLLYPLAMQVGAWLRSASSDPTGDPASLTVSVVLATREPDAAIARRVANLRRTSWTGPLEVVVACDAARAGGPATPPAGERVTVVMGATPGKAAALNAGVAAATGAIVVFADTGQLFEPDLIPRLVAALRSDPRLAAVSGALHIDGESRANVASLYWRYERALRAAEARIHSTIGVTGAAYALWRDTWAPLPPGLILDDLFTPMRLVLAGRRVGFDRGAIARDDREFAEAAEYQRKARTLTGVWQLCAWLPRVLHPGRNPVWLQFVSHKVLRLVTPWALLGLLIGGVGAAHARAPEETLRLVTAGTMAATLALMLSARLRHLAWGVVLMQAAIVTATWNALRGDWDVWRPRGQRSE